MAVALQSNRRRSRNRRSGRGSLVSEINVTPFVDVMLVLLVVFMITAPLLTTGVSVNLPKSGAPTILEQDEPLSITVTSEGEIFIQDTAIPKNELAAKLQAIAENRTEVRVFVRGDMSIDYGTVMSTVSAIKAAGLSNIALVTDSTSANP